MKLTKDFDKSLWVFHMNAGSCNGCDIEIVAALTPRYDVERFGIKLVGSPKHADVLLATGPVTREQFERVKRVYDQAAQPCALVVVGNCGTSCGVYYDSYNVFGPLDRHLFGTEGEFTDEALDWKGNLPPHTIYVPGCPPRPEAIIFGVANAWLVLEKLRGEA